MGNKSDNLSVGCCTGSVFFFVLRCFRLVGGISSTLHSNFPFPDKNKPKITPFETKNHKIQSKNPSYIKTFIECEIQAGKIDFKTMKLLELLKVTYVPDIRMHAIRSIVIMGECRVPSPEAWVRFLLFPPRNRYNIKNYLRDKYITS